MASDRYGELEMPEFCKHCGYFNRRLAVMCGSCGTMIDPVLTCTGCGAKNSRNEDLCKECGLDFLADPIPSTSGVYRPNPIWQYRPSLEFLTHILVALILSFAVIARVADLGTLTSGITHSELVIRSAVVNIVEGQFIGPWAVVSGGQPTGFVYGLASWAFVFGEDIALLRLMSAWLGLAAIGMFYVYCRSAFGRRAGVIGAVLLSVSIWHIEFSRQILPIGALVLLQISCSYVLLLALRHSSVNPNSYRLFMLAGALFGLAAYTHNAFYIFFLAVLVWWAREILLGEYPVSTVSRKCAVFFGCAVVISLPYCLSSVLQFEEIRGHLVSIDISTSQDYIGQSGMLDKSRFVIDRILQIPHRLLSTDTKDALRPIDPVTGILVLVGLLAGLWKWRQREFFHLWSLIATVFIVTALTQDAGIYSRLMVALPAIYAAAGCGCDTLLLLLKGRLNTTITVVLTVLILGLTGISNVWTYWESGAKPRDEKWYGAVMESGRTRTFASSKRPSNAAGNKVLRSPVCTLLEINVRTRTGKNELCLDNKGGMKAHVKQPAEGGKANAGVVRLVADWLGVARRDVSIVRGVKSKNKTLLVDGIDSATVKRLTIMLGVI